jgi:N4-(beta-N-acetylglucosaminyl)-L-asparaginase
VVNLAIKRKKDLKDIQVGFLALNKKGVYGSYCVQKGFSYAVHDTIGNRLLESDSHVK